MKDEIKWVRLKQLLQAELGESIDIICTTEFNNSDVPVFGFVGKGNDGAFKIVININEIKTVESVINVLAHEASHIITRSRVHDELHKEHMNRIKKALVDGY